MKPRLKPLTPPVPLSDRYWTADVPDKGKHTFKHPYYGVAAAVLMLLGKQTKHDPETDDRPLQAKALEILPVAGAIIGVCWAHPLHEFDAKIDLSHLDEDDLVAYSHAICEELQDAGYDLLTVIELFGKCVPEMAKRQSLLQMAEARANFTVAPGVA